MLCRVPGLGTPELAICTMAYTNPSAPPMPQQQDMGPPPGYPQQQQHQYQPSYAPNTTSRPEQVSAPLQLSQ